MGGFVDVHSHAVPSGDDGARSVEEALVLCRLAFDGGTRVLFATPHAHAAWDHYPRTPEREREFEKAFPVVRKRIAQEEQLFAMVRSESRTFAGIDIGEGIQV